MVMAYTCLISIYQRKKRNVDTLNRYLFFCSNMTLSSARLVTKHHTLQFTHIYMKYIYY